MSQNQYYYQQQQQQQYQQHSGYPQQLQRQPTMQYSTQQNPRLYPSQLPPQQQAQHLYQHQQSYTNTQPRLAYTQQQQQPSSQAFVQARQVFAQPQQQPQPQQYYTQQQRPQAQVQPHQSFPQLQRQSSFVQPPPPQQQQQVFYQQQPQPRSQSVAPPVVYPNTQQVYKPPPSSAPGSRFSHYTPPNPQPHAAPSRPVSASFSPPKPPQIESVLSSSSSNDPRRPLPTPTSKTKARPESMTSVPSVLRLQIFQNANLNPIPVQAPAPSSPTRPSVLNTPPSSISTKSSQSSLTSSSQSSSATPSDSASSSPTRSGGRPLPTPGSRATKHSSLDFGSSGSRSGSGPTFGVKMSSPSSSPGRQSPTIFSGNSTTFKSALSATKPVSQPSTSGKPKASVPFKSYRPVVPPPIVPEEIEIDLQKPGSPTKFVPLWKRGMPASSPSPERPSTSFNSNVSTSRAAASNGRPLPNSPTNAPDLSKVKVSPSQGSPLFNGVAPMGTRLPPPQHPHKKDVPPPPGKAFLSPKARKIELPPSDDEYLSANEAEGYADEESEWDGASENASESADGRYPEARTPSPTYAGVRQTLKFSFPNGNTTFGRRDRRDMVDLDDAPPPSLRRSPGPGSPQIPMQHSKTPPALPPRRWTPSVSAAVTHPNPRRSAPVQSQNVESPAPLGGRGSRSNIPTISLPDDDNTYEEEEDASDFGDGPTITISESDLPAPSRIAVSTPQISVSSPNSRPATRTASSTAASSQPSSSSSFPQPHHQARYNESKRELKILPAKKTGGLVCGGCDGKIIGRIVSAMGVRWHPGCFRCTVCNELLEHVSSYEHEGKPYCHLDYHENFAPRCYHCKTPIIDERFITLDDPALGKRTYHEQHFFCAECGDPFLAPRNGATHPPGELSVDGDGEFEEDNVGFTVYKGHPYCEACHVRLRMPKCKRCKKSIREGMQAVEALGGKWCWACFTCASCEKPFEDPSFFLRSGQPFCESCFSIILRNEV